jgi:hypothetical protein
MCSPSDGTPSKPDDLACIVFRRIITKADAVAITIGRDSQCEQPEC